MSELVDQPDFCEIPEADLDPVHIIQWEHDIIWDDPDDLDEPASELRGDAQNGAAGPREEDDWDDLDRALEMDVDQSRAQSAAWQRPVPFLEALPHRKVARTSFHQVPALLCFACRVLLRYWVNCCLLFGYVNHLHLQVVHAQS